MSYAQYTKPSGDCELDARRNERLAWQRLETEMLALADTPLLRAELPRRRVVHAHRLWADAIRQLDQVRS